MIGVASNMMIPVLQAAGIASVWACPGAASSRTVRIGARKSYKHHRSRAKR